jgi:alkylhydroperoxidase family enzyme
VELGRRLAVTPHRVPDELYARVAAYFSDEQMVALAAFGALMVATNVFNNALGVPLDDYLQPYRRQPALAAAGEGSGAHG